MPWILSIWTFEIQLLQYFWGRFWESLKPGLEMKENRRFYVHFQQSCFTKWFCNIINIWRTISQEAFYELALFTISAGGKLHGKTRNMLLKCKMKISTQYIPWYFWPCCNISVSEEYLVCIKAIVSSVKKNGESPGEWVHLSMRRIAYTRRVWERIVSSSRRKSLANHSL